MVQWDNKFGVFMVWNDAVRGNQKRILMCYTCRQCFYSSQQFFSKRNGCNYWSLRKMCKKNLVFCNYKKRKKRKSGVRYCFNSCLPHFLLFFFNGKCHSASFSSKITAPDSSCRSSLEAITEKHVQRGWRRKMKAANTGNDLCRLLAW